MMDCTESQDRRQWGREGDVGDWNHVASELPLVLILTPASPIVCGPPQERKEGGKTEDDRQGANHLQRIRDLFWNLKCFQFLKHSGSEFPYSSHQEKLMTVLFES